MAQQEENRLRLRLVKIRDTWSEAIQKKNSNRDKAEAWIRNCLRPAVKEVINELRNLGISDEPPTLGAKWKTDDIFELTLTFEHTQSQAGGKYTVDLAVSSKGVMGETKFNEVPVPPPTKPILQWTQEDVIEDFLRGCEGWDPVE